MSQEPVDAALRQEQVEAALAAIHRALEPAGIVGVYLFGSAVAGGLRADSDLDLFVVTGRPVTRDEKDRLVDGLRPISRRSSRPPGWRPLEVTVVTQSDVRPWRYPPRYELQYGEWLRDEDLHTQLDRGPVENPDLAVLIGMVRSTGKALVGQPPGESLDPVPAEDLARAINDEIPELIGDLQDDTRNVLLTLARAWATVATGEIRSKDAAAEWALVQLPPQHRPPLAHARDLYMDGGYGEWDHDMDRVRPLAHAMATRVEELVRAAQDRFADMGGKRHGLIFDEAPTLYDRYRPGYPESALQALIKLAQLTPGSAVLDVGAGTGQLTIPLLRAGLSVTALEPGPGMARVLARKLSPFPSARLIVARFEDADLSPESFDALVSATAFHWVDPDRRFTLAAHALKARGRLALLRNDHILSPANEAYYEAAQSIYERVAPELGPPFKPPTEGEVPRLAADVAAAPQFEVVAERRFTWDRAYTASELGGLLRTYSNHRSLPPAARRQLLDELRALINRDHGGSVVDRYLTRLCVARLVDAG